MLPLYVLCSGLFKGTNSLIIARLRRYYLTSNGGFLRLIHAQLERHGQSN